MPGRGWGHSLALALSSSAGCRYCCHPQAGIQGILEEGTPERGGKLADTVQRKVFARGTRKQLIEYVTSE